MGYPVKPVDLAKAAVGNLERVNSHHQQTPENVARASFVATQASVKVVLIISRWESEIAPSIKCVAYPVHSAYPYV